mgnify:CR=1 FL=1
MPYQYPIEGVNLPQCGETWHVREVPGWRRDLMQEALLAYPKEQRTRHVRTAWIAGATCQPDGTMDDNLAPAMARVRELRAGDFDALFDAVEKLNEFGGGAAEEKAGN